MKNQAIQNTRWKIFIQWCYHHLVHWRRHLQWPHQKKPMERPNAVTKKKYVATNCNACTVRTRLMFNYKSQATSCWCCYTVNYN